jgi:hypothetical protein
MTQQRPHRLAQCPREVDDRGIDADDEIQLLDDHGQIPKIARLQILHQDPGGKVSEIAAAFTVCRL